MCRPCNDGVPYGGFLVLCVIVIPLVLLILGVRSSSGAEGISSTMALSVHLHRNHLAAALLLFPGLFGFVLPFIFAAENPRISALLTASPLFENRFLPPNPYFWSRFCLLTLGPAPRSRPDLSLEGPASTSILWKMSLSSSVTAPVSWPLRSRRSKTVSIVIVMPGQPL